MPLEITKYVLSKIFYVEITKIIFDLYFELFYSSCVDLLLQMLQMSIGDISLNFFVNTLPYLELLQKSLLDAQKLIYAQENQQAEFVSE